MSGPLSGRYDPVKAEFSSVEAVKSPYTNDADMVPTAQFKRHIRLMVKTTLDAKREIVIQEKTESRDMIVIRVRRDSRTEQINSTWQYTHRGRLYQIIGSNPVDYALGELEFLAITKF